jgi:hypothetical protein
MCTDINFMFQFEFLQDFRYSFLHFSSPFFFCFPVVFLPLFENTDCLWHVDKKCQALCYIEFQTFSNRSIVTDSHILPDAKSAELAAGRHEYSTLFQNRCFDNPV